MANRPQRQAKGSGSVRQRTQGNWQLRYDGPPDPSGKPTKIAETVRGSRRDAERVLRERVGAVENGCYVPRSTQSVAEFMRRWLDTYVATNTTLRTQQGYRVNIKRMATVIGNIQLAGLQPQQIQKMYADMLDTGLSARTVLHTHRVLREALAHAVKWGVLARNPADAVDPPRPERKTLEMWDTETIDTFLEATEGIQFGDLYRFAILTGMRRSEVTGLKWQQVDLNKGKLSVVATLQRIVGKGLVEGQPKTGRSRRVIALSRTAVTLLHKIRGQQLENRLKSGPMWQETGYVFTQIDGTPVDPDRISRAFAHFVRDAELPHLTFHGLRHAHATLMLSAGVHPKVVSERLGHSNIAITMDTYSHVLPGLQEAAAEAIDDQLYGHA